MKNGVKYRFGDRLRDIRERKGVTLRAVAEKVGVSESLISQIERNRVSPSIDTLFSIVDVLGVDPDYLFRDYRQARKVNIVRSDERRTVVTEGVAYSQLSVLHEFDNEYAIEAFHMEIDAGGEKGSSDYGHPGMELGYILEGKGELVYGTETYPLRKGDSVSFSSDIPHVLRNTGKGRLTAMWVITPPRKLFFRE
ncbi:MAG TPA: cupin domain-containing protein [Spirochaetota bacterium]|nr:cupin domain-containing protein [Spirochaetota bacterium]